MKRIVLLVTVLVAGIFLAAALYSGQLPGGRPDEAAAQANVGAEYVGSETCQACHANIYDTFIQSGHAWKLNPVVDGNPPDYPFTEIPAPPEGYTWDDISYVIGGYNWKARFIDQEGYIITDQPGATISDTNYLNQYNFANPVIDQEDGWVKYKSGTAQLKYDCGTCHTTGYRPEGHQDDRPGIVGTWAEPGVRCEECHGPASLHVQNPQGVEMKVDRDAEACGKCHRRDAVEEVNAKDGFIEHHEQYEELFQSKHAVIDCVQCHNPHVGVVQLRQAEVQTTRTQCQNCHFKQAENQKVGSHAQLDVACVECHMPRIVKSAWGDAEKFTGDIRSHMMAIDPNQVGQFSEDGKVALSQISLDFACRHCHVEGGMASAKTDDELKAAATNYHVVEEE